jgi:hypothetical protein
VTEILEKHFIITGMLGKTRQRRQENNWCIGDVSNNNRWDRDVRKTIDLFEMLGKTIDVTKMLQKQLMYWRC